ncbi:Succinate-semialdehyde dehydrogenase [NADP(+)] GabD [Methyloligella halotolerans]|uniref:Succinate-semialdehyde dehydrogenase [NADP(+)] GabD n=1 Tax=Methyloligella halotolerans TaxID=1177755 RepID=A0A1E2RWQ0_9HYPH|nr:NAD-dependent succinate-semialdehyde dehydrogenase [Methyloligella halotolerans]ODA66560.1 Succinate-semialdehyde dehydrogenase [NADP(+)] GabD [Methyloligella halotolerans]
MKLQDHELLKEQCRIGDSWCGTPSLEVTNPATGSVIAKVPYLGAAETKQAIEAAEAALPAWRGMLAKDRAAILRRWYELQMSHQEDLAAIMTAEQGKPLSEARGEVAYAASFTELFAEEAKRVYGEIIPTPKAGARVLVERQPIGVVGAITPWNFPLAMITRKVSPALAAGCTVVCKPAEDTPLSALALMELAIRAGVPPGVFNIVTGDPKAIGGELTSNPTVRMITFTGSTEVGKLLMRQSASTVKKMGLELGGNAPLIVFDDADLERAVAGALASKFRNMGQTCVCANRILVQDGIFDRFADRLAEEVEQFKLGDGTEEGVDQGPLINEAGLEKVEAHVADAVDKGAKIKTGGKRATLGGTFFEPTVLTGATTEMLLANEETFGPVAALFRFTEEEEAIRIANDTPYGLAAYFFTRDLARAFRVSEALECGIVGVNEGLTSSEMVPFGGVKESGIGREGSHHGIDEFVEMKYILMGGLES